MTNFTKIRNLAVGIEQRAIQDGRKRDAEDADRIVNWLDSSRKETQWHIAKQSRQ